MIQLQGTLGRRLPADMVKKFYAFIEAEQAYVREMSGIWRRCGARQLEGRVRGGDGAILRPGP